MGKFEDAVNRIKEILATCENKKHTFAINDGLCTIMATPSVEFEGDSGDVDTIYLDENGTIMCCGNTEWDSFEVSIEVFSYDDVTNIMEVLETQLGLYVSPTFKRYDFQITSVCREDIAQLGYKGTEDISDEVMAKIAQKMCDAYVEHSFWEDLDYFVGEYCDLEKEKTD